MIDTRNSSQRRLKHLLPGPALAIAVVLVLWIGGVTAYRAAKGDAARDVEVRLTFFQAVSLDAVRFVYVYRSGFGEELLPELTRKDPERDQDSNKWWKTGLEEREFRWRVSRRWARDCAVHIEPEARQDLSRVEVRVGDGSWEIAVPRCGERLNPHPDGPDGNLHAIFGARGGPFTYHITQAVPPSHSFMPWFRGLVNYPGDRGFLAKWLGRWLRHPVTWLAAVWLAMVAGFTSLRQSVGRGVTRIGRRIFEKLVISCALDGPHGQEGRPSTVAAWAFFAAGLSLMGAAATYLEWRQARYFLRDDNFSIFFPTIHAAGCALAGGQFPEWTPRLFLGMPIAELGVFATTYPPTWISYLAAKVLLRDASWTIDIFCWLHLFCGYTACFYVLRRERAHPAVAAVGGLSWALCGYALIAGRSWYYMTPVFTFVPLLGGMLSELLTQPAAGSQEAFRTRSWIWRWGITWGLFYHAGNAQMWLYAVQLFSAGLLWAGLWRRLTRPMLGCVIRGTILALVMVSPLLVAQSVAVGSANRPPGPDAGIEDGIGAVFLPYPLAACDSPSDWADPRRGDAGHFYYAGTLFALAWLVMSAAAMSSRQGLRQWIANPWVPFGLLALWLALGTEGGLWWLQSHLPVLGRVYHPFKYLPFFHWATIVLGAKVIDRLLFATEESTAGTVEDSVATKSPTQRSVEKGPAIPPSPPLPRSLAYRGAALLTVCAILLSWHVMHADTAFYSFGDTGYPKLPAGMVWVLRPGAECARVMPIAPFRSPAAGFVSGLGLNFPLMYGVESIGGYGEFVRRSREYEQLEAALQSDPVTAMREYGVTHLVLHRCAVQPCLSGAQDARRAETETLYRDPRIRSLCRDVEPVFWSESVAIFPIAKTMPRAFGSLAAASSTSSHPEVPGRSVGWADPAVINLPTKIADAVVVVDTRSMPGGGRVTIDYLCRPRSTVWIDGRQVVPSADRFGRMIVDIPPGTRQIVVGYEGAWTIGWLMSVVLMVVFTILGRTAARARPR